MRTYIFPNLPAIILICYVINGKLFPNFNLLGFTAVYYDYLTNFLLLNVVQVHNNCKIYFSILDARGHSQSSQKEQREIRSYEDDF